MDDSLSMSGIECIGHLDSHGRGPHRCRAVAIDEVLKGARVEKLHHNEGLPVRLDDLANGANVGVIQRGGPGTAMILGHSHYDQQEPNSKPQNDLERSKHGRSPPQIGRGAV